MATIIYVGPGNNWKVAIKKSKVTGKKTQLADVSLRTACTFIKTHTGEGS